MAGAAQHPTRLPWTFITIGFVLFYLALYTRTVDWSDGRRAVAFTALTQNLLTLYLKGYSPQFLVMLLPFVLLLIPGWRGIAYALLLSVVNLVEYPIYFHRAARRTLGPGRHRPAAHADPDRADRRIRGPGV